MDKKFDVIAMGELLIDFTAAGQSRQGNGLFEACPGGAPCNVLAMLNKLGRRTGFIGKVGEDSFGRSLKNLLDERGIDTSHLLFDPQVHTTLAFVHTGDHGERDFAFYRNPGADMMLDETEVDADFLKQTRLFHFGTLSMTHEGVRKATKKALATAKENGILISFDPNLRPPLWESLATAREQMEYGFRFCDILKISDNEIRFATGMEDYDDGIRYLQETYHIPLIFLTMGSDGSRAYYRDLKVECEALQCNAIETTGAGDTFCGSALHHILKYGLERLTKEQLLETLRFANTAAAIVTTRKGAIRAMPEKDEVEKLKNSSY